MSPSTRRVKSALALIAAVILSACRTPAPLSLDCQFTPVQGPEDELAHCASAEADGSLLMAPTMIDAVRRRDHAPVAVVVGGTLYYANPDGRSAPTLWYDNGADYFSEGLARTVRQGKVGFVDRDLVEQIAPSWDFAFPFDGGAALVCRGCRPHQVGEHRDMRGGVWGYIDRNGVEIVPVRFGQASVPPPPPR